MVLGFCGVLPGRNSEKSQQVPNASQSALARLGGSDRVGAECLEHTETDPLDRLQGQTGSHLRPRSQVRRTPHLGCGRFWHYLEHQSLRNACADSQRVPDSKRLGVVCRRVEKRRPGGKSDEPSSPANHVPQRNRERWNLKKRGPCGIGWAFWFYSKKFKKSLFREPTTPFPE